MASGTRLTINDEVKRVLDNKEPAPRALLTTIDGTHSGYMNRNFAFYTEDGMQKSHHTMTSPYSIPLIANHDREKSKPFGRIVFTKFLTMDSVANAQDHMVRIYDDGVHVGEVELRVSDDDTKLSPLYNVSRQPTGFIRSIAQITDKSAIESVLNREYDTVSVYGSALGATCGIPWCKKNLASGMCGHKRGKVYINDRTNEKSVGHIIFDGIIYKELSYVNVPADSFSGTRRWQTYVDGELIDVDSLDLRKYVLDMAETRGKGVSFSQDTNSNSKKESSMADQKQKLSLLDMFDMSDSDIQDAISSTHEFETEDAKLSYEARQNLKDSDFCYVKEVDGKKVRKFPAQDASHVRNGLARLSQSDLSAEDKASVLKCLKSRAKKHGIEVSDEGEATDIILSDATVEQILELEIADSLREKVIQDSDKDIRTLLSSMTELRERVNDSENVINTLKEELSTKDAEISRLTEDNTSLQEKVHGDLATQVVDKKIELKVADGIEYWNKSEEEREAFRATMIQDHQSRSSNSLSDTLSDLNKMVVSDTDKGEEKKEDGEKAPAEDNQKEPTETVANDGLSVEDATKITSSTTTSNKKVDVEETRSSRVRRAFGA